MTIDRSSGIVLKEGLNMSPQAGNASGSAGKGSEMG